MLIYSSNIEFRPDGGVPEIVQIIAKWLSVKGGQQVGHVRLVEGIKNLVLKNGQHVQSESLGFSQNKISYPFMFACQLSHADDQISGRRWVTEVGVKCVSEGSNVECSFLLKTDEVSARVTAAITVTRPWLVEELSKRCNPVYSSPGIKVKTLNVESAPGYLSEVESTDRKVPLVVVSAIKNGNYFIDPKRLASLLLGIADVVVVPGDVNSYELEEVVGKKYAAWGGAINIIFASRNVSVPSGTFLYLPSQLEDMVHQDIDIGSEILSAVTHRTNLPNSWRHTSLGAVTNARLMSKIESRILDKSTSQDVSEYVELLQAADKELREKDDLIDSIRLDYDEKLNDEAKLSAEIQALKYRISVLTSSSSAKSLDIDIESLRNLIFDIHEDNYSLEVCLKLISTLFSDRVVVLDSAYDSAKSSDRNGFKYPQKAFELMFKLLTGYWAELSSGRGDQHAKTILGHNSYAQNEGGALSKDGKKSRTFLYNGKDYVLEKHLKIGVKDSAAETLRIHFEWLADDRVILIGHCGEHINF